MNDKKGFRKNSDRTRKVSTFSDIEPIDGTYPPIANQTTDLSANQSAKQGTNQTVDATQSAPQKDTPFASKVVSANTSNTSSSKPSTIETLSRSCEKYASILCNVKYPSRWRLPIIGISALLCIAIIVSYCMLDLLDILPGPLTLRPQESALSVAPIRQIKEVSTLTQPVGYGKKISNQKANKLVKDLLSDPSVGNDTSAVIMDARGQIVAERFARTPREPASTLKTLTAAVASRTLDMGATLDTQVFMLPTKTNAPKSASRRAQLVLRGSGDMLLGVGENDIHHVNGRAGLATLANRTAEVLALDKIHEVTLAVDDSLFGAKREPSLVYETDDEHRFYAKTSSVAIDCARQRDIVAQGVDADAGSDFPLSDPNPAASVGRVFAQLLRNKGIQVHAANLSNLTKSAKTKGNQPATSSAPASDSEIPVSFTQSLIVANSQLIAKVSSAPLNEIMGYMLRLSDNTLAEEFGRLTALAAHKSNDPEGGVKAVEEGLHKLHIDTRGLHMSDCSGLSPKSSIRALTLAQVQLLNVARNSGGSAAAQGLSLPGLVGSTRRRLVDPSAKGLLRVKTGSLSNVTSMSGNVSRRGGGVLTFAVIVNNPNNGWGASVAINKFMAELPNL